MILAILWQCVWLSGEASAIHAALRFIDLNIKISGFSMNITGI